MYGYDPVSAELTPDEAKHVLGTQAQLWTEYMPNPKHVEYMAYPRACAHAEVAWTPPAVKDYADFQARLEHTSGAPGDPGRELPPPLTRE